MNLQSNESGLGTSGDSEENSEGSWKLTSKQESNKSNKSSKSNNIKKTNRNNGTFKTPELNYNHLSNFGGKIQQFNHFRPLPSIPTDQNNKETKYNTFYQINKDKSNRIVSEFQKSKSLKKPSGIPGASSLFHPNYSKKKKSDQLEWIG